MLHDRYCDYLGRTSPHWAAASWAFIVIFSSTALLLPPAIASDAGASAKPSLVIIGSINVDIIVPVFRLPNLGETITARNPRSDQAVGGKGANQAIAAARMMGPLRKRPRFICRFGNDAYASNLEAALIAAGVDVSGSGRDESMPSGQGIVLLEADGTASSIVVGGSNVAWPENVSMHHIVHDAGAVLLQREVPEHVNIAAAKAAKKAGVTVLQDVGGEDRPISDDMLSYIDYLSLNESELERLTGSRSSSEEQTIDKAKRLIKRGARNVLVTLAERGSLLVATDGTVLRQAAYPVPGGKVLDATAAGDAFRAGFAVALVEGRPLQQCLQFAAAAGAFAVSRMGAVPSLPTRDEVLSLLPKDIAAGFAHDIDTAAESHCSQGASSLKQRRDVIECGNGVDFPFKFASRLNSMQARRDLTNKAAESNDVLGWIARQSRVQGLDLVDFNYPQHFNGLTIQQLNKSLSAAGLQTGAVCLRFPEEYRLGAFTNPDAALRQKAVDLAIQGCRWAADLGARELIVWSAYDGYDYHFQVNYTAAWQWTVAAFQLLADSCPPGVLVSLEFKPTDEATRFSVVPSTGAALLLVRDVDRPNFGLTLDVGHLLMAGENPAQSAALVGAAGKLFGVQLNDAHVKLGAEDGLAFGAVNPVMALEFVAWLREVNYSGHIYFDTFPRKEDPVKEAEYNIKRFKAFWARAEQIADVKAYTAKHDALGLLEFLMEDETFGSHKNVHYKRECGINPAFS